MTLPFPTFVGKGTHTHGTGGLSVPMPAGILEGDLLILFVESENQTIAEPSGWDEIWDSPEFTGTAGNDAAVRLAIFYKTAGSSEGNVSVGDSGDHTSAIVHAWRGAYQSLVLHDQNASSSTSSTSVSWPSITTGANNSIVVNALASSQDTTTAQCSGYANASLANVTERSDDFTTDAGGGGISVCSGELATRGSSGVTTATLANASVQSMITFGIRPAKDPTWPTLANTNQAIASGDLDFPYDLTGMTPNGGDLMVIAIETANEAVTTPSGFTALTAQGVGTGGGTGATRLSVFYRVMDGDETGFFIPDPGDHYVAWVARFSGVDPINPINVSAGDTLGTPSATITAPTATTTVDGCLVLALATADTDGLNNGSFNSNGNNNLGFFPNYSNSLFSSEGNGGNIYIAIGWKETAGATGTTVGSIGSTAVQARMTIALNPISNRVLFADSAGISVTTDLVTFEPAPPVYDLILETFENTPMTASLPGQADWVDGFGVATYSRTTSHVTEGTYTWRAQAGAGEVILLGNQFSFIGREADETLIKVTVHIATIHANSCVLMDVNGLSQVHTPLGATGDFELEMDIAGLVDFELEMVGITIYAADFVDDTFNFLSGPADIYLDYLWTPGNTVVPDTGVGRAYGLIIA